MKKIAVLGSTGSIGRQSLDVIKSSGGEFCASCICAGSDAEGLAAQANEFRPDVVGICDESRVKELKAALRYSPDIVAGHDAAALCAGQTDADTVVNGVSGIAGFLPLVAAVEAGKRIAAANKESIVCAHTLLENMRTCGSGGLVSPFPNGAQILPVDSEQSAIFQCIEKPENVKSLILTASGGAFRDLTYDELKYVTAEQALSHPTWSMGRNITIDSATLFNKGLEIMEAAFLFGTDDVEVLIHKQSIVHSMVRFKDGSVKAQLSLPDMRGAIQYAFTYPDRVKSPVPDLDLTAQSLTFSHPDTKKYPAVELAYEALHEGRVLPVVYNAANETAREKFINGECGFTDIAKIVAYAMKKADTAMQYATVGCIIEIDEMARRYAREADISR